MDEAPLTSVGKWEAALELLRAAALHEQYLVEFYSAVQNIAKKDGYELCRGYELDRMEMDFRDMRNAVQTAIGTLRTSHTPRVGQHYPKFT